MAMTDQARRSLFARLVEVLGDADAVTLIDELPPAGHDVVTRQYLDERLSAFGAELRGEMAELRAELRSEMTELRAELRGEMTELRGEMRSEMAELRGEMAELRGEMAKHTRVTVLAVVTMNAATIGAVAALLAG